MKRALLLVGTGLALGGCPADKEEIARLNSLLAAERQERAAADQARTDAESRQFDTGTVMIYQPLLNGALQRIGVVAAWSSGTEVWVLLDGVTDATGISPITYAYISSGTPKMKLLAEVGKSLVFKKEYAAVVDSSGNVPNDFGSSDFCDSWEGQLESDVSGANAKCFKVTNTTGVDDWPPPTVVN